MKARLFFIASTILLLFYACSKQEVRIPDSVVEHSIATKEIKVLYDHVATQLSSKMHSLGYADILPDYESIKYHYQDASHEAAYMPIFRNATTGVYIQLTVFKKDKLLRSIITVMKPGSGWNKKESDYCRFTGEMQFYGSNGLFVKRMLVINGLVVDGTVDDKEFISTRVLVSGSEISLPPPLLANDIKSANVEPPSPVLMAARVLSCSQCHGAQDNPCAGRWGEFGCGELTEVVVVSTPQQPPAFLPFLPDPYAPPILPATPMGSIANSTFVAGAGGGIDPKEFLKCFNASVSSQFKITVNVDQPSPGSRDTYTTGNNTGSSGGSSGSSKGGSIDVGHTFLTLEQINVDGTSIRRVIGFYPASSVNPASPSSPGSFLNDAGHNYDVSLTTVVNSQIFMNFVNSLKITTPTYNLNSNNCTSICINNLQAAGIQLPQTIGSWPLGSGFNPADLGEDIRSMQLQPNQTRSNKTEKALENTGACQ